jgi:hypothetical protein
MTNGIGNNFSHQPYGGMTMSTMPCLIMNKKEKVGAQSKWHFEKICNIGYLGGFLIVVIEF